MIKLQKSFIKEHNIFYKYSYNNILPKSIVFFKNNKKLNNLIMMQKYWFYGF